MNIWFTSDLHFGHRGVLAHSKRPFPDTATMDDWLIFRWNSVVRPEDHVYVLGDFSFKGQAYTLGILGQLRGRKFLVRGNHDKGLGATAASMFEWVKDYHTFKDGTTRAVLCHFPFKSWDRMHYGAWNLHGHCHGTLRGSHGRQLDVGVDPAQHTFKDYRPFHLDEIRTLIGDKPIWSVDHHEPREG